MDWTYWACLDRHWSQGGGLYSDWTHRMDGPHWAKVCGDWTYWLDGCKGL